MYTRVNSEEICYECKNRVGEARPTTSLMTEKGLIRLCKSCGEKFNKHVNKINGIPAIRECARCKTIVAEDYQPCYVLERPEEEFWLCMTCDEITDKEIEADKKEHHS